MCVMVTYGLRAGSIEAEKQEFRDALDRMTGIVELEVVMCIVCDFNTHVGVAELGEDECVGKFGCGVMNRGLRTGGKEWDGHSWFILSEEIVEQAGLEDRASCVNMEGNVQDPEWN